MMGLHCPALWNDRGGAWMYAARGPGGVPMTDSSGGAGGEAQFTGRGAEHVGVLSRCMIQQGASSVGDVSGDVGLIVNEKLQPGLVCVDVQLAGFSIETSDRSNRHVKQVKVGVTQVRYNDKTGDLGFEVFARFHDADESGDFVKFQVFYTILALG
jgi:hypothetical protein